MIFWTSTPAPAFARSAGNSNNSAPGSYNTPTEVGGPAPVQSPNEGFVTHADAPENITTQMERNAHADDTAAHGRPPSHRRDADDDSEYDVPDNYANLDEVTTLAPTEIPDEDGLSIYESLEGSIRTDDDDEYDVPDNYANLDDAAPSPSENPDENRIYFHQSLEGARREEEEYQKNHETDSTARSKQPDEKEREKKPAHQVSKLATQLYTISYLILFSFLGTLARLGLQTITFYPGAPVVNSVIWANFGGSLFMGFLSEDRMLFKEEWGTGHYHQKIQEAKKRAKDEESASGSEDVVDLEAAKKAHLATKKTLPLYIGLATGFCGCFTSFGSFMRDSYLAMSNKLPTPLNHPEDYSPVLASTSSTVQRNGGFSFMAVLAVLITTIALSMSALHVGAHIAIASERYTPSLPYRFCRKILDPLAVVLAWGCWAGAIMLAIFPPDRYDGPPEIWRGRAVFELVFSPIGCLARFYLSLYLNGKMPSFPLGTFIANIFGTMVLGMSWDLQHVPLGSVVGCQVLQGIEGGFCGCLTTVSTWVSELSSLRRRHAYRYGAASVVVAFCSLVAIMGSVQWTRGFSDLQCTH